MPPPAEDFMTYAKRMSRLGTETAFEVLARARALEEQGRKIVHLEIGEPDFDTPKFIRQAIAKQWKAERAIPCEAENVVVTPGAKPIMFFVMLALLEEGDEVLYPN